MALMNSSVFGDNYWNWKFITTGVQLNQLFNPNEH